MSKYVLDANTLITAWNRDYPPSVFQTLWDKLPRYRDRMVFIKPVYDEIDPISQSDRKLSRIELNQYYPLRCWLEECRFEVAELNRETQSSAIQLELKYQTSNNSKGANQTDIALIAFAKSHSFSVVSLEAHQTQPPNKICNYKIPLICRREGVAHLSFIDFLAEVGFSV